MHLTTILVPGGSRLAIITLYSASRTTLIEAQRKVFDHFDITSNQIECPFPAQSHGWFLDRVVEQTISQWDYFIILDSDAIPLRADFVTQIWDKIKDGETLFGGAQQSNHIFVNGTTQHVYASSSFIAFSRNLFEKLGRPSFDHGPRGDCCEELTWRAKEKGFNVAIVYPSHVVDPCYPLDNGLHFGQGTTYGSLVYHNYCMNRPESEAMFIAKCAEVVGQPVS